MLIMSESKKERQLSVENIERSVVLMLQRKHRRLPPLTDEIGCSIPIDSCEEAQVGMVVVPLVEPKGHLREDVPVHFLPFFIPVITRHSKVGIHSCSPSKCPKVRLWEKVIQDDGYDVGIICNNFLIAWEPDTLVA